MKSNRLLFILAASAFLLLSCSEDNGKGTEMEHVRIPFDQIVTLDVSEGEVIPLETTDESLLAHVTNIEKMHDMFVVSTPKSVMRFDAAGKYLGHVGALGHGNSEYIDTRNVFTSEDRIHIFDWSSRKVNSYDADGKFLSMLNIELGEGNIYPSTLYRLGDGMFLSHNCYQGPTIATPAFSVLSPSSEMLYHIEGRNLTDAITHNELRYSPSTNTLLYAEAFYDTIYRVSPVDKKVTKAYYIDYGEHKYTEEEKAGKDFMELCAYSNLEENKNKAALMYCSYETADRMMFVFVYQVPHFIIYDKNEHSAHVFRLEDKSGKLMPMLFAAYTEDEVFFLCEDLSDMQNNPVLVRMPYNRMMTLCQEPQK